MSCCSQAHTALHAKPRRSRYAYEQSCPKFYTRLPQARKYLQATPAAPTEDEDTGTALKLRVLMLRLPAAFLAPLLAALASTCCSPACSQPSPLATSAQPLADALSERVEEIGRSVQNRPIRVYVLENRTPSSTRDITLIYAAVHGNESSTPGVVKRLRAHLKQHPEIVRGRRILLMPTLNPDGLAHGTRRNAHNVDINRNYPGTWKLIREKSGFRGGRSAASEPETRAMIRLVTLYRPRKIVSIHQPLHCIIYSGQRSKTLALALQKNNSYPIQTGAGYPTPGGFGGFGGYCDKIIQTPVVTLELPWQSPQVAWNQNARGLLAAIALPPGF